MSNQKKRKITEREGVSTVSVSVGTQTEPAGKRGVCSICTEQKVVYQCGGTCKNEDQRICADCVIEDNTFDKNGCVKCAQCTKHYTPTWINDNMNVLRKMNKLLRAETELSEAVPALFAEVGDRFSHRSDDSHHDPDIFEYEGRTAEGWLIFHHIEGDGFYTANGGVRDAIGAYPIWYYFVDEDRIKLPPMCYMFRELPEDYYDPEESEPIFTAIRTRDNDLVRQLIQEAPNIVNHRSEVTGCPVSHYITMHGTEDLQMEVFSDTRTNVNLIWEIVKNKNRFAFYHFFIFFITIIFVIIIIIYLSYSIFYLTSRSGSRTYNLVSSWLK